MILISTNEFPGCRRWFLVDLFFNTSYNDVSSKRVETLANSFMVSVVFFSLFFPSVCEAKRKKLWKGAPIRLLHKGGGAHSVKLYLLGYKNSHNRERSPQIISIALICSFLGYKRNTSTPEIRHERSNKRCQHVGESVTLFFRYTWIVWCTYMKFHLLTILNAGSRLILQFVYPSICTILKILAASMFQIFKI